MTQKPHRRCNRFPRGSLSAASVNSSTLLRPTIEGSSYTEYSDSPVHMRAELIEWSHQDAMENEIELISVSD
jgi:hypothetical protein